MVDLPRRPFTFLPPPPGGSAGPRRRGRARQRRQALVAASASVVVIASVVGLGLASTTSAIDRLEPEQFASPSAGPTGDPGTGGTARPTPSSADSAPASPAASKPAAEPGTASSAQPTGAPATAPATTPGGSARPVLQRSYQPPPEPAGATVCGARAEGPVGAPATRIGWCTAVEVGDSSSSGSGSRYLTVRACRSSEAAAADLHVDTGAIALRVEQDERVLWRLELPDEPAAVLRTDPGGCWRWRYTWDGLADNGKPVPAGSATALGRSLSDELRDTEVSQAYTSEG